MENTTTVKMDRMQKYVHIATELQDIEPEYRMNADGTRCLLRCKGMWRYEDETESGEVEFQHAETCPFRLADELASERARRRERDERTRKHLRFRG